jgi:hypothetical protein
VITVDGDVVLASCFERINKITVSMVSKYSTFNCMLRPASPTVHSHQQ